MKTILRIIVILLVASAVAGAFSLAVNNSSTTSTESGQPAMTNADGQTFPPAERPEGGDRESGSIVGGLGGVFTTLIKITSVVLLVLGLQKGFDLIYNNKRTLVQR